MDSVLELYYKIKNLEYREIPRFMLLLVLNGFTLGMLIYGSYVKPDFTMWMLGLFIINLAIYFIFYIIQKVLHREKIGWKKWVFLIINQIVLVAAIIFFTIPVNDKYLSPNESRELNQPCVLFNYWDYHDIWHILSATGLFMFMLISLYIDNDLQDTNTNEIPIF